MPLFRDEDEVTDAPQYIPDALDLSDSQPDARAMVRQLFSPEYISQLQKQSQPAGFGVEDIMQFFPQLSGVASNIMRRKEARSANAGQTLAQIAQQQNSDRTYEIQKAQEDRAQEEARVKRDAYERGQSGMTPEAEFLRKAMGGIVKNPELQGLLQNMSGAQLEEGFKNILPALNFDAARQESAARLAETRAGRAQSREISDRGFQASQEEKELKKKSALNEVENRRQNIHAAIDQLDTMIDKDGTFNLMGSHNQTMDRLVTEIATDMAKLQDPESVARPGEVENVRTNLIESGFKNKNATARDILKNFKADVERRAAAAYKIRGLAPPESPPGEGASPSIDKSAVEAEMKRRGLL